MNAREITLNDAKRQFTGTTTIVETSEGLRINGWIWDLKSFKTLLHISQCKSVSFTCRTSRNGVYCDCYCCSVSKYFENKEL